MTCFVLLHGAWHGGWCWDRVASRLRDMGHRVMAPTLPGLSERAAELTKHTGLTTFIEDTCEWLEKKSCSQFVLVAHSFGGAVARGVHARFTNHISGLVLLDALNPGPGQTPHETLPAATVAARRAAAVLTGDVMTVPVPPLDALGVVLEEDTRWIAGRLSPHPLRSFDDVLTAVTPVTVPAIYIVCTQPRLPTLQASIARAEQEGFTLVELAAPHDAMITHPAELAMVLADFAGKTPADEVSPDH